MEELKGETKTAATLARRERDIACFGLPRMQSRATSINSDTNDRSRNIIASTTEDRPHNVFISRLNETKPEPKPKPSVLKCHERMREVAKGNDKLKKRQLGMRFFLRPSKASFLESTRKENSPNEHAIPYEENGIASPSFPLKYAQGSILASMPQSQLELVSESSELETQMSNAVSEGRVREAEESNVNLLQDERFDETTDDDRKKLNQLEDAVAARENGEKHDVVTASRNEMNSQEGRQERQRKRQKNRYIFATKYFLSPQGVPHTAAWANANDTGDSPKSWVDSMHDPSILSVLVQRSSYSARRKIGPSRSMLRFANSGKRWGMSDTVEFECVGTSAVACMEFDSQGVLLATADVKGAIQVFDFDEVNAAAVRVKNERCKNAAASIPMGQEGQDLAHRRSGVDSVPPMETNAFRDGYPIEKALIRPVVSFHAKPASLPSGGLQVTCIRWNPYHQDELAVSFLTQAEVCVYDVASCPSPMATPQSIRLMDGKHRHGHSRGEGTLSLMFLPSNNTLSRIVTGSTRGIVRLWTLPSFSAGAAPQQMQQSVKMKWEVSSFSALSPVNCGSFEMASETEGVSDMVPLSNREKDTGLELLLIGGTKGSVVLLDIKRCTRKAFSTALTPTVMNCWNVPQMILEQQLVTGKLPPRNWMGVKKICVWSKMKESYDNMTQKAALCLAFKAIMVANCGWVIELSIDTTSKRINVSIVHKAKQVTYLNSDYDVIDEMSDSFSLPRYATPASELYGSASLLCLAQVKPQHLVLADKDKRILDNTPLPNMVYLDGDGGEAIISIDIKGTSMGTGSLRRSDHIISKVHVGSVPPRALTMHPSSEWIVLGCEGTKNVKLLCNQREYTL